MCVGGDRCGLDMSVFMAQRLTRGIKPAPVRLAVCLLAVQLSFSSHLGLNPVDQALVVNVCVSLHALVSA